MAIRHRCAECRKTFMPEPSARKTQRVCGEACRAARNRDLAQARRRRDLDDARADERARKRASRIRRAEAGCHAPASARKCPLSTKEVGEFVDRALDRSRATLVREVRSILLRLAPGFGESKADGPAMSRASLGAQAAEMMSVSGRNLAELSRISLGERDPL